jgi:hypothetical protein
VRKVMVSKLLVVLLSVMASTPLLLVAVAEVFLATGFGAGAGLLRHKVAIPVMASLQLAVLPPVMASTPKLEQAATACHSSALEQMTA